MFSSLSKPHIVTELMCVFENAIHFSVHNQACTIGKVSFSSTVLLKH